MAIQHKYRYIWEHNRCEINTNMNIILCAYSLKFNSGHARMVLFLKRRILSGKVPQRDFVMDYASYHVPIGH